MRATEDKVSTETQLKTLEIQKKRLQESQNHYNKRIDDEKKSVKKYEYDTTNL